MKKFFKILMVFALLSGAALSCTKDYSKEIADVQKQNQDLQALVASLQNALNSTNATVSQLTSTSDKQAADIAALASANAETFAEIVADHADDVAYLEGLIADLEAAGAADLAAAVEELEAAIKAGDEKAAAATEEKIAAAIKACDEKAAEALADAVTTCKEDIEKLEKAFDGKIEDLNATLTAALEAKAKALEEAIEKVEGKAAANATAIAEIEKTLKEIDATLTEYKGLIDKNAEAIAKNAGDIIALGKKIDQNKDDVAAAKKEIEAIKEQIAKLSARLTNIVAAPAKDVEIQSFKWKTIEKTTVNMNFIVAPAEAAEAVAEGFKNEEVNVTLYINSGKTRAAAPDTCDYVIIPNKVEAKDGIITISAIVDTTFDSTVKDDWSYYATLAVSGEDKAGEWERISDPVKPIFGGGAEVTYAWYANDKAVKTTTATSIEGDDAIKLGAKDSVALGSDGILYIVKKDWDWKSEQLTIKNIIDGYSPIIVVGNVAYSSNDFKKAFGLDTLDIAPRFVGLKQTFKEPFEWGANNVYDEDDAAKLKADSALFKAKINTGLPDTGFTINLPEKEEDQIEVVGKATKFEAKKIAFGKIDTCGLGICFVQRIGKHVEEEKATEAQTVKFGINGTPAQAAKATATFTPVEWLTTSILGNMGQANIYDAEDKTVEGASVKVESISGSSKFVKIEVASVPYAAKEQALKIKWASDTKQNTNGVVVLEHGDYIDLTVEKYHDAVSKDYDFGEVYISRKDVPTTFQSGITAKDVLGAYTDWSIKDVLAKDDSTAIYDWFKSNALKNTVPTCAPESVGEASEFGFITEKDSIKFAFKKGTEFKEGQKVTIGVKDSIDKVIKFNYTFTFTPSAPKVAIATIPGFVQNGQIRVEGKIVDNKYVINDINLANYFKFKDVDKKYADDEVTVKFTNTPTGIKYDDSDTTYTLSGKDALPANAKIKWDTLKATRFELTAQAFVQGETSETPVTVTVWTDDPILDPISGVKIDSTLNGKEAKFELLNGLKIFGTAEPKKNIYPSDLGIYGGNVSVNNSDKSDWTCTVNGVDFDVTKLATFNESTNELTYKAHDAVGEVVITIPYKFTYNLGEKKFNVVLTIN